MKKIRIGIEVLKFWLFTCICNYLLLILVEKYDKEIFKTVQGFTSVVLCIALAIIATPLWNIYLEYVSRKEYEYRLPMDKEALSDLVQAWIHSDDMVVKDNNGEVIKGATIEMDLESLKERIDKTVVE